MCEEVGQDTLKGSEGPVSLLSSFLIKMLHKKLFPLGMPPPSQKSPYDSILLISQSNSTATSCIKIEARAGRKSPFSNSLSTVPVSSAALERVGEWTPNSARFHHLRETLLGSLTPHARQPLV